MKFGTFFVMQRPDHVSERTLYQAEVPQMVATEALGFDSVWVAEHHFSNYGACSAPVVLLAAIAGQTTRLHVGTGITLLPLHDPIQLAEELAVLDQVSGGRLDVGIGRASTSEEYQGYNVPYEESRARVDEGIEILRGAWTQAPFSYAGKFRRVDGVRVTPRPVQQPHPPLYMACNSPESVPIAARHGVAMMSFTGVSDIELAERAEVYRQAAAAAGHPPVAVEALLAETWTTRYVYVAEDPRAALEEPRPHMLGYQAFGGERRRRSGRARPIAPYEEQIGVTAFFGTPDQVAEQITQFQARSGVNKLLCHMSFHAMDPEMALRSMHLFATQVMPRFTDDG